MGSVGILSPRAVWRPRATAAVLVLVAAAWSVAVLGTWVGALVLPLPGGLVLALVFGVPALAVILLAVTHRIPGATARWVAGWMALVGSALAAALVIPIQPLIVLAVPALLACAATFGRRPAAGLAFVFLVSGTYGSLNAFWQIPYEKITAGILGGLWIALGFRWLVLGRSRDAGLPVGLALLLGYIAATLAQVALADDVDVAIGGFFDSGWFLLMVPLVAYAGWSATSHLRVARAIIAVGLLVGAYATYRWFVGPAPKEFAAFGGNPYNYVGDELRLLGSFPSGPDLGSWTALAIPFCLAFALTFGGRWRWAAIAAVGLCLIALVGSELRIALAAVVVGSALTVLLYQLARAFPGVRLGTAAVLLTAAIAAGVGAFAFTGGSSDPDAHGYGTLLNPSRDDKSVDERVYKWEQALEDLDGRPFGYGVGTATSSQSTRFYENVGAYNVDSAYLKVALEQGLIMMVLFAVALLATLVGLARRAVVATSRMGAGLAIGACGTLASMIVLMTAANYADGPRALAVWMILGLGLAQFTTRRPDDSSAGS